MPTFLSLFKTLGAGLSVSKHLSSWAQKALLLEDRTMNHKAILSEGLTSTHVKSMANPDRSPTLPDLSENELVP